MTLVGDIYTIKLLTRLCTLREYKGLVTPYQLLHLQCIYICVQYCKRIFIIFADVSNFPPKLTTAPPPIDVKLFNPFSCGKVFEKALNGSFQSPGYPNFRHNQDCGWVILAPAGYFLSFNISVSMDGTRYGTG